MSLMCNEYSVKADARTSHVQVVARQASTRTLVAARGRSRPGTVTGFMGLGRLGPAHRLARGPLR